MPGGARGVLDVPRGPRGVPGVQGALPGGPRAAPVGSTEVRNIIGTEDSQGISPSYYNVYNGGVTPKYI